MPNLFLQRHDYTEVDTGHNTIYAQGTIYNYDSQATLQGTMQRGGSVGATTVTQFYYDAVASKGVFTGAYQGGVVTGTQSKAGGSGNDGFTGTAIYNILVTYGYNTPGGNSSDLIGSGGVTSQPLLENFYLWWDTPEQSKITLWSPNSGSTATSSTFTFNPTGYVSSVSKSSETDAYIDNAFGEITSRIVNSGSSAPVQYYYFIGGTEVGDNGDNGTSNVDYAQSITNHNTAASTNHFAYGGAIESAAFGDIYDPINPTSQAPTGSTYVVRDADTLQSIAQSLWGDSSLWYLIADANGLDGVEALTAGTTLQIPSKVTNLHNGSSTFSVYNPNTTLGNVQPRQPKPPKQDGCGGIGAIIVAIVAIAVNVIFPEIGAAVDNVIGSVLNPLVDAVADPLIGASSVADASVELVESGIENAVAGGLAGDAIGQGVAIAVGAQNGFNWSELALAGISAGVGFGLGNIPNPLSGAGPLAAVGRGVAGSVITQGIGVATGLQNSFSWTNVAVAGVEAGVGYEVGGALGGPMGAQGQFANSPVGAADAILTGTARLLAGAASESVLSGRDFGQSLQDQLPSAIGQTVGNLIASEEQPSPTQTLMPVPTPVTAGQAVTLTGVDGNPAGFVSAADDPQLQALQNIVWDSGSSGTGGAAAPVSSSTSSSSPANSATYAMTPIVWTHVDGRWVGMVSALQSDTDTTGTVHEDGAAGAIYFRALANTDDSDPGAPPDITGAWQGNGSTGGFTYQFMSSDGSSASWDMTSPARLDALGVGVGLSSADAASVSGISDMPLGDAPAPWEIIGPGDVAEGVRIGWAVLSKVGEELFAQNVAPTVVRDVAPTAVNDAVTVLSRTGCFVAGTMVHGRGGIQPIESVQIGDFVLSQPDQTGERGYCRVIETFVYDDKSILEVTYADALGRSEGVLSTYLHPFWVKGVGWQGAQFLKIGQTLELHDGSEARVTGVVETGRKERVFNFTVDGFHTYYVGSLGVWVHNIECYDTPEAAIGMVQGRGNIINNVPADEPYYIQNGYTRIHYFLDAEGDQWTVPYNPSTGKWAAGHESTW